LKVFEAATWNKGLRLSLKIGINHGIGASQLSSFDLATNVNVICRRGLAPEVLREINNCQTVHFKVSLVVFQKFLLNCWAS